MRHIELLNLVLLFSQLVAKLPVTALQLHTVRLTIIGDVLFQDPQLLLECPVPIAGHGIHDRRHVLRLDGAREDAVERVVVPCRNGIKLVIMAASTPHRQPQQAARDHIDAIINDVRGIVEETPPQREEPHGRQGAFVLPER